jgi:lipopolysaccharide transport system permease protein
MVAIRARGSRAAPNLRELWEYRDLFYFLTMRDIKVRYKQTALGATWAVIQPLFATLTFALFFGRLAKMPSEGIPYPLYVYTAMTMWSFFANSVTQGGNSLVSNANLISKVYFPRLLVPAAAVAGGLLDFAISFVVQIGMLVYYRVPISATLWLLPVSIFLVLVLGTAVGLWMSALNVKYRDVRYALPFLIQLWMFATPIIYPPTIVPERWRWLLSLNPMTGLIGSFRAAMFGLPENWSSLGLAAVISTFALLYASYSFRRMERHFADVV